MRRRALALPFIILLLHLPSAATAVQREERAHIYDAQGYAVPCPAAYVQSGYLPVSTDFPQDITLGPPGRLFVSDSGNARVLELETGGRPVRSLTSGRLTRPGGLFWDAASESLYVTDEPSATVLRFSEDGTLRGVYPPPRSDVLPEDYLYAPTRLVVDARGWLSIIGTGSSGGIIQLDADGIFRGFFGANPASTSLLRRLTRALASPEQKRSQRLQVLQPYSDITLDADGFMSTVTETLPQGQIRRLNALGNSAFPAGVFGEPVPVETGDGTRLDPPHLSCIATDADGIVTVADRLTLRIFQYSPDGELLFAWGGKGELAGSFQSIAEITVDRGNGTLYVLDGVAGAVQVFTPTAFARLVYRGARLYVEGRYEEALDVWTAVRVLDANYPLANKGIAKVLLRLGTALGRRDYLKAAMERSREAGDRAGFSDAFAAHRRLWIQGAMPYLLLGIAVLFVLAVTSARRARGRKPRPATPWQAWRALSHPFLVMEEIKWEWEPRHAWASLAVLVLCLAARFAQVLASAYHLSPWDPGQVNLAGEATRILLPWITWVAANALVTAIFRGEGKLRQIFSASAYAMVPYAVITILLTLLSHVLALPERGFLVALQGLMVAWMILLFLLGAGTVHGYTLRTTVGTSALSLAGIVILWGVAILVLGLVSTFVGFIMDVAREISLRA
jgi:hypothetical protein